MRSRLTDYFRRQAKFSAELSISPEVFSGEAEEDSPDFGLQAAVVRRTASTPDNSAIKDEIEAANKLFCEYGFSFYDLAACSPKSEKTRKMCARAVAFLMDRPLLITEMRRTKQLPLKALEQPGIPRKTLERHRKYMIAAAEILLHDDFPCLKEYMHSIREEGRQ